MNASAEALALLEKHILDKNVGLVLEHIISLNLRLACLTDNECLSLQEIDLTTIHLALHLSTCFLIESLK